MPWTGFRVELPTLEGNSSSWGCQPLKTVSHVAHLEAAHRIVQDGRIRSGLVFDASLLNQERILVSWLSPNDWRNGFRYGSIQFKFDWSSLLEGHRTYWVESIPYTPPACRILLTRNDFTGQHGLVPYDPTLGNGPWWFDATNKTHYWNGRFCLEFMVEHDIELSQAQDIAFVDHHSDQCSINPKTCTEKALQRITSGARFLSRLAASGLVLPSPLREAEACTCREFVEYTLMHVMFAATYNIHAFEGDLTPAHPSSFPAARAFLHACSIPSLSEDIPELARLFRSADDLRECCSYLLKEVVQFPVVL